MESAERYFRSCVEYWKSTGLNEGAATVRAIWWDCVETWNADGSWTEEKIAFINRYRSYEPYGPVPEAKAVEEGNA